MNKQNNNKESYLDGVISAIIVFVCLIFGTAAVVILSNSKKIDSGKTTLAAITVEKTETANKGGSSASEIDLTGDNVRDLSSIELTEIEDWENSPYEILQPEQILSDIEAVSQNRPSKFNYTYNGNLIFTIGSSNMSTKPYFKVYNVDGNGYNYDPSFDLNKWSVFKSKENIVFSGTDYVQNGINEEYKFVTIKKDGTASEEIKYIDLLGYQEEYDELRTLPGVDATLVRKDNVMKLVRDAVVIDEKVFPDGIQKDWHWSISSSFITDEGVLYYVLLDKSDMKKPTINAVKAGENVSNRQNYERAYDENDQSWQIFTDKNGDDVTFVMDSDVWKDSSVTSNMLTDTEYSEHTPASEWEITRVSLSIPTKFELSYVERKHDNPIDVINGEEVAYWTIQFYYGDEIFTSAVMPGIDDTIFLSKEDADKFDGKSFDIDELETVRKEVASLYDSYVEKEYENFLKN